MGGSNVEQMIYFSISNVVNHKLMGKMDKKKKPKEDKQISEVPPKQAEPPVKEEEKPFDFGGLPQRDLKKNLGCG